MPGFLQDVFKATSENNASKFFGFILLFLLEVLSSVDGYISFPKVTYFLQLQSLFELTDLLLEFPYSGFEGRFSKHLTGSLLSKLI